MYTEQELYRIEMLFMDIEANKEHEYAAPTYKDTAALKEMARIIESNCEDSVEVWENKIPALGYLAHCYDQMCRTGISVRFHKLHLEAYARLNALRGLSEEETKVLRDALYHAVKARNAYDNDQCEDLFALLADCLPAEKMQEMLKEAGKHYIKKDPVELTEAYLAVIDEVEEKIESNRQTDVCFEAWQLKEEYLAAHGIKWRSPAVLNPRVRFD